MGKTMTLQEYLRMVGPSKIAEELGISKQAVYAWADFNSSPRPTLAAALIEVSLGVLTWESIYSPYAEYDRLRTVEQKTLFDGIEK